jgi:hypothetical protein
MGWHIYLPEGHITPEVLPSNGASLADVLSASLTAPNASAERSNVTHCDDFLITCIYSLSPS